MNQSSLFTEEGRARSHSNRGFLTICTILLLLVSGGASYLTYRYYTWDNLTDLQRTYFRQFTWSFFRSHIPVLGDRLSSVYSTFDRVVTDPKTNKKMEVACFDDQLILMKDESGHGLKMADGNPDYRLKAEVPHEKYFLNRQKVSDREMYAWWKRLFYENSEFYELFYPAGAAFALLFIPGIALAGYLSNLRTKRFLRGKYIRGTRKLTEREYERAHRKEQSGLSLEVAGKSRLSVAPMAEFEGIFLLGDPGTGKSQTIHQFLRQVGYRRPVEAGICFDPACEFLEAHFNPERDVVLNPLDKRFPYWSPVFEVKNATDRQLIADSFFPVPDSVPPQSRFFVEAARQIFMHLLRYEMSPTEIVECLCDDRKIDELIAGSEHQHLIPKEAKAQRSGVLGTLSKVGETLKMLPCEEECEERISLTEWAKNRRGWIYVTSTQETRDALRPLQTAFLNILTKRLLSFDREQGQERPCWLVIDEVHALKNLPALPVVLAEGRKYGVKPILGTQSKFQMHAHYGEIAATMIAQAKLKIYLRTNEPEAARWISDSIGEEDWERPRVGTSAATSGDKRNSVSYSTYRDVRPVVSKEQVMALRDMSGYWKCGEEVVQFAISPVGQQRVTKDFLPRESIKEAPLTRPGGKLSTLTEAPAQVEMNAAAATAATTAQPRTVATPSTPTQEEAMTQPPVKSAAAQAGAGYTHAASLILDQTPSETPETTTTRATERSFSSAPEERNSSLSSTPPAEKRIPSYGISIGEGFSAPKSVSLAALVGGDKRVAAAHRESVDMALTELEKYAQARMGGNKPAAATEKMIVAKFEHDAARPDRLNGYAAPQLHTHCVIFNLTETDDGKIKPMQEIELYRSQALATAVYRASLAERLHKLGYEIEVDGRTGAPEIKGFSKEYLQENSPRSQEVKRSAQEIKERLEGQGIEIKEGAGLNQAAARANRAEKKYDRDLMRERHRELDAKYDYRAKHVVEEAIARGPRLEQHQEIAKRAKEAVTFARDNAMEREAVADMRRVMVDALRRNLGLTTYEAVKAELSAREERGEFIGIVRENKPQQQQAAMTTDRMLEMERSNIRRMQEGQGLQQPITAAESAKQSLENISQRQGLTLNDDQRQAVERILTSRDQIIGLQGGAGTGKTAALSSVKGIAEGEGYEVKGFAPTTRAAQALSESGIETRTLQKFLRQKKESASMERGSRLYVLDESSLASTKNVHEFFSRLRPEDKVLLVGDTRQHQAIEAGSPFQQFQNHGMETAKLTEIVRQRRAELKQVVEKLSTNQVKEAVGQLHSQGRVIEIKSEAKRLRTIADEYCRSAEGTLVISPANKERIAINNLIHERLQSAGSVSPENHVTKIYVNRQDMSGTERTFANAYQPGEDVVRYSRASKKYGVEAGEYAQVVAKDHRENTITVRFSDGREVTYNPERLSGVSVYREAERAFSEGDRIQFRAPFTGQRIANGELGQIEKIEGSQFSVKLEKGREVSFKTEDFRHLDYGYAVTSYSSQGQTVERVIVNANTRESELLLNSRSGYVALSRARDEGMIYTNSANDLAGVLDRRVDKEMALEAVGQSSQLDFVAGRGANKSALAQTILPESPAQSHLVGAEEAHHGNGQGATNIPHRSAQQMVVRAGATEKTTVRTVIEESIELSII